MISHIQLVGIVFSRSNNQVFQHYSQIKKNYPFKKTILL